MINATSVARWIENDCWDHNGSTVVSICIDFLSGQCLASISWIFDRIAPTAEIVFGDMIMVPGDTTSIILRSESKRNDQNPFLNRFEVYLRDFAGTPF